MFVMITETQLVEVIKEAKTSTKPKKFTQAVELIINFKDISSKYTNAHLMPHRKQSNGSKP